MNFDQQSNNTFGLLCPNGNSLSRST